MISLIIPMYNVAQYLPKCIESAYNQGMSDSEFEVVIIDDESPDNSLEIVKKLTCKKNNVTIISQKNRGLGGARNTGIENAKGDYVLFLDSDDIILPNMLKNCVVLAQKQNLDILEFGAQGINPVGKVVYTFSVSSEDKIYDGITYYHNVRYIDSACNKLYKRDFLNINNLRFIEKIFIEDYEFNTRAFYLAKRVMASSSIVSHFLQSPNSITRSNNTEKREKMKQDIMQVIKRIDIQKKTASPEKVNFFNQRLSYLTATLFYQLVKDNVSYQEYKDLKQLMVSNNIFFVDYPIYDKKKNFFRILFLKNFFLFKLISKIL